MGIETHWGKIEDDFDEGGIKSVYDTDEFNKAKKTLENAEYRIISLEEQAMLRIKVGIQERLKCKTNMAYGFFDSEILKKGNWVKEGVLYLPKRGVYLTKNSPITVNAQKATRCHRKKSEFYLTHEQIEESLKNSCKIPDKEIVSIPTLRFADEELAVYAFGKQAKNYGLLLNSERIKNMSIQVSKVGDMPFSRQLWFGNLHTDSMIIGNIRGLDGRFALRGIKYDTAEFKNKAQKNKYI